MRRIIPCGRMRLVWSSARGDSLPSTSEVAPPDVMARCARPRTAVTREMGKQRQVALEAQPAGLRVVPDVGDPCSFGEMAHLIQTPAAGLGDLKVASALAAQLDGGAAALRVSCVALPVRQGGGVGGGVWEAG